MYIDGRTNKQFQNQNQSKIKKKHFNLLNFKK